MSFLYEGVCFNAQVGHLGIVRGQGFLQPFIRLDARERHGAFALALSCSLALGNIACELRRTHLADDIGVARLVDLKHLTAMRALDLVHGAPLAGLL